uniref:Uncharacterized protein n=1 Tax=Oryza brachyantha TaxID=4533 RepID=J3LDZ3_ORYBR
MVTWIGTMASDEEGNIMRRPFCRHYLDILSPSREHLQMYELAEIGGFGSLPIL